MNNWWFLLYIVSALFLGWYVFRRIQQNPKAFSKANLNKSAYTLGILALILIAFIYGLVVLIR